MKNLLNQVEFELRLKELDYNIDLEFERINIYTGYLDIAYKDKLRDKDTIEGISKRINTLVKIVNDINELEVKAIKEKCKNIMFKCEYKKARIINMINYLQARY